MSVYRLEWAGRLASLNGKGKKAFYEKGAVVKLRAQLLAEKNPRLLQVSRPISSTEIMHGPRAADDAESARADRINDLVSNANSHSEEFFKLTVGAVAKFGELSQRLFDSSARFHEKEHDRLTQRIETLESERTELFELLERTRRDEQAAKEKQLNYELIRETFVEGRTIFKAILASKLRSGDVKEGVVASAIDGFIASLQPSQLDKIAGALTPDQLAAFMSILATTAPATAPAAAAEPPANVSPAA